MPMFNQNETPQQRMQRMMMVQNGFNGGIGSGLGAIGTALASKFGNNGSGQFPAAPGNSFPATPPAPTNMAPMGSAADVYAGQAQQGMSNNGAMVSRDPLGNIGITNKYGVTSYTNADGNGVARWGAPASGKTSAVAAALNGAPAQTGKQGSGGVRGFLRGLFGLGNSGGLY